MTSRPLPLHIASITDVAERQLCAGCGVCAYVQPDDIEMVDDLDAGRRPLVRNDDGIEPATDRALDACPGVGLEHGTPPGGIVEELRQSWGPVLELWEGFSSDPVVRRMASSGGAATALALHGLANESMHGILHARARDDVPYLNTTTLSTTREDLLAATGSRYAPASPCDRLDLIAGAPAPSMLVGKPCDIAGAARAAENDARLSANLGLTIAVFCGGTPTLRGTFEMLRAMGIEDPDSIESLRYRGDGWPGMATAALQTEDGRQERSLTYDESWGAILQRHRQWRCYVCADHTGEFADISVGDPWYREIEPGEPGRSLIVVRTERGRRFLHAALSAGVLEAARVDADRLPASQPGLLKVRGAVWGRITMSRILGVPAPRYSGLPTFPAWLHHLGPRLKLRSMYGLVRRIRRKGLRRRHPVRPWRPSPTSDTGDLAAKKDGTVS